MEVKQIRSPYVQSEIDTTLVDEVARSYIDAAIAQALARLVGRCVEKEDKDYNRLKVKSVEHSNALGLLADAVNTKLVEASVAKVTKLFGRQARILDLSVDIISKFEAPRAMIGIVDAHDVNAKAVDADEATIGKASISSGDAVFQSVQSDIVATDAIESKTADITSAHIEHIDSEQVNTRGIAATSILAESISVDELSMANAMARTFCSDKGEIGRLMTDDLKSQAIETTSLISDTINGISSSTLSRAVSMLKGEGLILVKDGRAYNVLPKDLLNHDSLSDCDKDNHKQYLNLNGRGGVQSVEGSISISGDLSVVGCGREFAVHSDNINARRGNIGSLRAALVKYKDDKELLANGDMSIGFVGSSLKYCIGGVVYAMATKTSARVNLLPELKTAGTYVIKGLLVNPMSCIIQVRDMNSGGAIVNDVTISSTESTLKIKLPYESVSCVALLLEV